MNGIGMTYCVVTENRIEWSTVIWTLWKFNFIRWQRNGMWYMAQCFMKTQISAIHCCVIILLDRVRYMAQGYI